MPHLDDIWYVGRTRAEGVHGDLDGGQRSSEVKWGKLCAMATIFGQKKPWCKLRMMTLMEVKGHQRSNGVKYVLWLPYLVKRSADASWEWWWPWWRSKVRGQMGQTMCYGYHIWSKFKLRMTMTFMEVKGHQRSNMVTYVVAGQEKPHMCFWPLNMHFAKIRSCYIRGFALNVFRGQRHIRGFPAQWRCAMATIFGQKNDDDLHGGQRFIRGQML